MSVFLFGFITHTIESPYEGKEQIDRFINFLYTIQKIGIEQRLAIFIGCIQPKDPDDLYELVPEHLKNTERSFSFMIVRSPMDNTSDELFNDWEYEASQAGYVLGKENVFKELENFFEQVFSLDEVTSVWLRYQGMFECNVNKLETLKNWESQIYKQCSESNIFEVSDFEIYKKK